MIVALVLLYLYTGIGFAWALEGNGIQRSVTIAFWLPLITYGMVYDLITIWLERGYVYDTDEDTQS